MSIECAQYRSVRSYVLACAAVYPVSVSPNESPPQSFVNATLDFKNVRLQPRLIACACRILYASAPYGYGHSFGFVGPGPEARADGANPDRHQYPSNA